MCHYSAFQIYQPHRHNQNLVGTFHGTSLLWSAEMKTAVYYVRRQAPGNEVGEEIWELTMATEREEQEWEKTLKLRGAVNVDEDRVLRLV